MTGETRTFKFTMKRTADGAEITPATISLPLFVEYNEQVLRFLRGSGKGADLVDSRVGIEDGSFRLAVTLDAAIAATLAPDFARLQQQDSLGDIDPMRARVIREWQAEARKYPDRAYSIEEIGDVDVKPVTVNVQSDYHRRDDDQWVQVEKYLTGKIYEAGGKNKANLHLLLEDSNQAIIIETPEELLRNDPQNRLYHEARLRVTARQNLRTGQLKEFRLLEFAELAREFDETAYQRLVERGTQAWAGVADAGAWVEEQRGGDNA